MAEALRLICSMGLCCSQKQAVGDGSKPPTEAATLKWLVFLSSYSMEAAKGFSHV